MAFSFIHKHPVDVEKIILQHEKQVALGNMNVNARGDEIGAGGKVIKTREEIMEKFYEANPNLNDKAVANIKFTKTPETVENIVEEVKKEPEVSSGKKHKKVISNETFFGDDLTNEDIAKIQKEVNHND